METQPPRTVLSLVRVSGKPQIDRTGIPRQLEDIAIHCKTYNLKIADGGEYRFEGLSGASVKKSPKYRDMLRRIADPQIAGLVFSDVSRFFRPELLSQYSILEHFETGKLMFCDQGVLDLRIQKDQTLLRVAAESAAMQRRQIKEWTHRGKEIRRRQGNCKTDPLPAGVTFVPHSKEKDELVTGHFEYKPVEAAERMKDAFRRILAGESQAAVARELHFASPTALRKALLSRWWIGEKEVKYFRVGRTMRDDGTIYDGLRVPRENTTPVKANFNEPPLISRQDFFAVQDILNQRQKTWIKTKAKAIQQATPFLGHRVLYCGICNMKLYPKPVRRKHIVRNYYLCSSNANNHKPCGMPMLHQEVVDQEILVYATIRLTNPDYLKTLTPTQPVTNTVAIQKDIERLNKKKAKQYARIGEDGVDEELLMKLIKENEDEIKRLEKELQAKPKPTTFHPTDLRKRFLNFGKLSLDEQKERINKTFKKLTVDDEGSVIGVELRR